MGYRRSQVQVLSGALEFYNSKMSLISQRDREVAHTVAQKDREASATIAQRDRETDKKVSADIEMTRMAQEHEEEGAEPEAMMRKASKDMERAKKLKKQEETPDAISALTKSLEDLKKLIALQLEAQNQTNRILTSPKKQSISNVEFGADGVVKSATVTPTIN